MADHAKKPVRKPARNRGRAQQGAGGGLKIAAFAVLAAAISGAVYLGAHMFSVNDAGDAGGKPAAVATSGGTDATTGKDSTSQGANDAAKKSDDSAKKDDAAKKDEAGSKTTSASTGNASNSAGKSEDKGKDGSSSSSSSSNASSKDSKDAATTSDAKGTNDAKGSASSTDSSAAASTDVSGGNDGSYDGGTAPAEPAVFIPVFNYPTDGSWIEGEACASSVDESGTITASQIPFDDDMPQVGLERCTGAYDHLGDYVEIRYNGMVVRAQVVDCGGYNGGNTGILLNPGVFYQFGVWSADDWGRRPVEYRFV